MNRAELQTLGAGLIAALLFGLFQWNKQELQNALEPLNVQAAHLFIETLAFAVCFSILILGWMVFVPTLCRQRLLTAAFFIGAGLLNWLHAISLPGMPLYDAAEGTPPSIVLNWLSQSLGAGGLFVLFAVRNAKVKPATRLLAIVPVLILVLAAAGVLLFSGNGPSASFVERIAPYHQASTLLLYAAAVAVILYKYRIERPEAMLTFIQALIWLFVAKLEQAQGIEILGVSHLFGDLLKLFGLYCLMKGIYLVLIEEPYKRQKKTEAQINFMAYHDELTSLPNRRLFAERVKAEIVRAGREKIKFAVLWLDLDRFKTINDSMGHTFGDRLLVAVADRLLKFADKAENVFRLGGDEFTVLISNIHREEEAEERVQQLVALFEAPVVIGHSAFHITTSIGMAVYPDDGVSLDLLLQNADTAMYGAKETRNGWKRYAPSMNVQAKDRLSLENDLRIALELGEFHLAYQPLIDLERERVVGTEALLRWSHPQKGQIPPSEFIPLCEESGFILLLGEWVLRTACKQAKAWQDQGYAPIVVSVNLSIRQFRQHDLTERIEKVLEETQFDPHYLDLEITESVMADAAFATETLGRLKQLGVRISIDDFGTGYSSLSYLKRFPIDKLKIDRSFIIDVLTDRNDSAIVAGICAMAHNLNLKVTAEGVETIGQVEFLKGLHCQEAQGYYYSRPVAPEKFVELLDKDQTKTEPGLTVLGDESV